MVKKLKLVTLFTLFFLLGVSLQAQTVMTGTTKTGGFQVKDPSFEDWTQTFDGKPALGGGSTGANTGKGLWYGANVYKSVLGIDVYGQVVYQTTEAKSGTFAAKLMDTKVGAAGITETSPSWVTLGTPWAFLDGVNTKSATAGTDGGITFTARPDTMSVWIKRVSNGQEDINLVYYSWTGTSESNKYWSKGKSCQQTDKTHYDEESDIRLSKDGNKCGTSGNAEQVAEGHIRTKAQYTNWTQVKVPIEYYTNNVPEKMNIILSASNYPNFRSDEDLYEGNYMIVDDLSFIYSSKIRDINLDGKPIANFNEDKYEYTYELGEDATDASIPKNIECFRSGRKLSGSEISIQKSTKLGEPTVIKVTAEDGSSTSTYKITFVRTLNINSTLNNIFVNGEAVPSFSGSVKEYNVTLPYGTTSAPQITFTKGHAAQEVKVTSCNTFPCTATVVVTAENTAYTTTYKLNFKTGELTDNTLQDIKINGKSIPGFNPNTTVYRVEMPLGTTVDPTIEAISKYPAGAQKIVIVNKGLNGTSTITVTPPSSDAKPRTYSISYVIKASSYSKLSSLSVKGYSLTPAFSSETTQYSVSLPVGTTSVPEITWVKGDEYQTVALVNEGVNGTSKVTVKAQDGTQTIYRITFSVVKSSVNTLKNIFVDGVALAGFSPEVKNYDYNVAATATSRPEVTWEAGDAYQIVTKNPVSEASAKIVGETKLTVRPQDGSASNIYIINFTQKLSDNSKLAGLSVAGYELSPAFSADVTEYTCELGRGTTSLPAISYVKGDETQTVRISENGVNGTAEITVRAQSGTFTVYKIKFSVPVSSDATLKDIMVGGVSVEDFKPETTEYNITLPSGTTALPSIEAVKNDEAQRIIINKGGVNGTTTIRVIAEDATEQTYKLNFSVEKSANALLQDILIDGVSLADFNPETLNYRYVLASDATHSPTVKAVGYAGQTIAVTTPKLLGTARIEVKPETGASNIYTIEFVYAMSSNNKLADIQVNGENIGFSPEVNDYTVALPSGASLPVVSYTKGEDLQSVQLINGGFNSATEIKVMAEDGSLNTYTITFDVAKSGNAQLAGISVSEYELVPAFSADVYAYEVKLPFDATSLPVLTYTKGDNAQQVLMTVPSMVGVATIKVTSEDALATNTYTIAFSKEINADATLKDIFVNGAGIAEFDAATTLYTLDYISGSALPTISYEKANATQQVVVNNAGVNGCTLTVTAQSGATTTYVITYNVIPSDNALLSDIQIYNSNEEEFESIEGFDANTEVYNITLPWRTKVLPVIYPIPAAKGQVISINEGGVEGATTIHVLAADGVTEKTYTLNFSTAKSSVATLSHILFDGEIFVDFQPETTEYVVELPSITKSSPVIGYINGEYEGKYVTEQNVVVTDGGLYGLTTVQVTSEDGVNVKEYKFTYKIKDSGKANILTKLLINGENILEEGKFDYNFELAAGESIPEISVEKNYPEQEVRLVKYANSYRIELVSNQQDVENVVYNVNFSYPVNNKAYISGMALSNNAKLYPAFDANVSKYVALVTSENDVNAVLAEGLSDDEKTAITQTRVSNRYTVTTPNRTYTVYMHYNSDVIPNGDFTDWSDKTINNNREKPKGWTVLADVASYHGNDGWFTKKYTFGDEVVKVDGSKASLSTIAACASTGGSIAGMMTLGDINIKLGDANETTTSISGGITFRNTPDTLKMRYNFVAKNLVTNMRVAYQLSADGTNYKELEHTDDQTGAGFVERELDLKSIGVASPAKMNIIINSAQSDNCKDLVDDGAFGTGCYGKTGATSNLLFDYIRFSYSSAISDIKVNNVSASKNGNNFSIELDSEYDGEPIVDIIGEVEDQAYDVVWTIHDKYSRSATIRSYAEDASYTDYTLTITRAKSANNKLAALQVVDLPTEVESLKIYPVEFNPETLEYTVSVPCTSTELPDVMVSPASKLSTVSISAVNNLQPLVALAEEQQTVDAQVTITVTAENGDSQDYVVKFVKERSNIATLKDLSVDGYTFDEGATFDAANLEYKVTLPAGTQELPLVRYTKESEAQTVVVAKDLTTTLAVTSEDGSVTQTYTIEFAIESAPTSAKLSALEVANGSALEPTFSSDVFEYSSTLKEAFAALVYSKEFDSDVLGVVLTDEKATLKVSGTNVEDQEYVINFNKVLSDNVLLSNIKVNGADIEGGFDPLTADYEVGVDKNAVCDLEPVIAQEGQTMEITFDEATSTYTIVVTAEDGVTTNVENPYTVKVVVREDNNADLAAILINGEDKLPEFDAELKYTYLVETEMPKWNSPAVPTVEVIAGTEGQTVNVELNGLNKVSYITVTAEDGVTQKVYELTLEEEKSTYAYLSDIAENYATLDGFAPETLKPYIINVPAGKERPEITYSLGDAYQEVEVEETGNILKLIVTAEAGNTETYEITFEKQYSGDAHLANIILGDNNVLTPAFDPDEQRYSCELPVGTKVLPEIGVITGADGQTVDIETNGVNGDAVITVTADDGVTTMEYIISFTVELSTVDTLLDIQIDGQSIEGFDANQFDYTKDLPVGTRTFPVVTWTVGDEYQTVTPNEVLIDNYNKVVTLIVTAQDTTFKNVYTVNLVVEKSAVDTLKDIQFDAIPYVEFTDKEFDAQNDNFTVELPIGTEKYPEVTFTKGDEYQTVTPNVNDSIVTLHVMAEDGVSERTYTIKFVILHSSNADLTNIFINNEELPGFNPANTLYNYVLPYGTTDMSVVSYELGDQWQVVNETDNGINGAYILEVVAEDGTTKKYIINFSVAKSDNALLSNIIVDGREDMPNFDPETFSYTYDLPYGETVIPTITGVKSEEGQNVEVKNATSLDGISTITVTAEDGETSNVYEVKWANKKSDNAALKMIYLDGEELPEFNPMENQYEVTLPYGTQELPEITWTLGDADQSATLSVTDLVAVINVTAQDETPNIYTIYFTIEKSAENRLKNIFIKGEAIEGFNPDTLAYNIVYPYGTKESELPTILDITYELYVPMEQVEMLTDSGTLLIRVTAENGDIRTYAIVQSIALNSNTKLDDILINGKSLDGFTPEVLEYTYILPFGSLVVPEDITYVASDTTQTVVISKKPLGEPTMIFVTAQDGTEVVYKIHFSVNGFDPSTEPTVDNVCVTSLPDGKWRFTTNCSNVSLLISTLDGKLMLLTDLELVDINIPNICSEEANGFVFDAPEGQILVYYFIHMNKRTVKSGKFRTTINNE